MTYERTRVISHSEADAWHEEVNSLVDSWISGTTTNSQAQRFCEWAIREMQVVDEYAGFNHDEDVAIDEQGQRTYDKMEEAWLKVRSLRNLFKALTYASNYGGDDPPTVRRGLFANQRAIERHSTASTQAGRDVERKTKDLARQIRADLGIPLRVRSYD